jgi:D-alanyl-D-alanine carboxypeptidase/D-alanyl-D-alanine-endopeptidase (penicillin-binding protein 4)
MSLGWLAWLASTAAMAQATGLPPAVAEALRASGVPAEGVSIVVLPADGGPARLDHQSQVPRQPASVAKLFTTGAALVTLGPAFTWRTDVALGGPLRPDGGLEGPLYVRGSGDPSLVLENVWLMMSRWRAAGLRDIQDGIVLDRRAFDVPPHDPAAFDASPLKPYNAGPDALLLSHQAITLRFVPDAANPGQVRVSMEPELDGVQLDNRVQLRRGMACGAWREALGIEMRPTAQASLAPTPSLEGSSAVTPSASAHEPVRWTLSIRGPFPESCQTREWPLLWQGDGGGDHAKRLLLGMWRQVGGRLGGAPEAAKAAELPTPIRDGAWPADAVIWQSWTSPPLGKVVQDINKFSNNVMARQLFLTMAPPPWPATLDKARDAVMSQVRSATRQVATSASPCDGEALVLDNGAGLSRTERSSAACLARWLQSMWMSPVMPEFFASLPVAGVDGTARRLNGVAGRAHIKTGSLEGVMSIAGVVHGESGRRYVVVAIVNHPQASAARAALDAVLGWVTRDGVRSAP